MSDVREDRELNCMVLQRLLRTLPPPALSSAQLEHLSTCDACMEVLIEHGVSSAPVPVIPANFAANLCAHLPAGALDSMPVRRSRLSGVAISCIVLIVLFCIGSVVFAAVPDRWLPQGWLGVGLEYMLVAEIVFLATWLGTRHPTR